MTLPPVCHLKMEAFRSAPYPSTLQVDLLACSPHYFFRAEREAGML